MSYPKNLLPSEEKIRGYLLSEERTLSVYVYDTLDSTNTEARRRLAQGEVHPCLLVAHTQTAGKGRLGRTFYSPPGSGLYMTLMYTVTGVGEDGVCVTSAAAVAASDAIREVFGREVGIKWVNDLYLDGKKVGGILAEAVPLQHGYAVILGIGINITTRDFPDGMRHPAGAMLGEADAPVDQSLLCARITNALLTYLKPEQRTPCLERYRRRLLLTGRRVVCSHNFSPDGAPDAAMSDEGIVEGVDDDYGLILRLADGTRRVFHSGEISVYDV